jgi:hypothetical protein
VGAAAIAAGPFLFYNLTVFGHWLGGYFWVSSSHPFFTHPLLPGLAGLLASPAKGLLVFSPFLAFLVGRAAPAGAAVRKSPSEVPPQGAGTADGLRPAPADRLLEWTMAAAVLAQVYGVARSDYRAGACYGPRYLTDMLPVLVWLLLPVIARLRGWGLRAFVAAVAAGIAIQAIGAFCYPRGRSDDLFYPQGLDRMVIAPSVWPPGNAAFLVEARAGLAPPELLPHRQGR